MKRSRDEMSCTVALRGHDFCDAPAVEGAPFPICKRHVRQVLETYLPMVYDPPLEEQEQDLNAPSDEGSVVYYVNFGDDTVKIRTSTNLKNRLATFIRSEADVLATEPGDYRLETARHRQFAADKLERGTSRELFRLSPALKSHIDMLNRLSSAAG